MPPTLQASHSAEPAVDKFMTDEGHPQEHPADILKRIKILLADEDLNPCLNFTEDRLPQIEEYIKHVQDEQLIADEDKSIQRLFKEVKTMAEVHRDWISRADASPKETTCCDTPVALNYSARFQTLQPGQEEDAQLDQMRLITQMRDYHPPFSTERSSDHSEFLEEMLKDAQDNQDEIDEEDSLTTLENRAYQWTLRQPSLIPYWMHHGGLPTSGQPRNKTPWERNKPSGASSQEPSLPDHLKQREDTINGLLVLTRTRQLTKEENESLRELLYIHEPPHIKKLHDDATRAQIKYAWSSVEPNRAMISSTDAFDEAFQVWIDTLAEKGVVLKVKRGGRVEGTFDPTLPPGTWQISDSQPSEQAYVELRHDEDRINELIQTHENPYESGELRDLLLPYLPSTDNMARDLREALTHQLEIENVSLAAYKSMPQADKDILYKGSIERLSEADLRSHSWLVAKFEVFSTELARYRPRVELQYSRPGEITTPRYSEESMSDGRPVLLYRLWDSDPDSVSLPIDAGRPSPQFGELETRLNSLLYRRDILSRKEEKELDRLLQNVMHPFLRTLAANYLLVEKPQPVDKRAYEDAYFPWRDALGITGVKLRIPLPGHDDSLAGIMCYRNPNDLPDGCKDINDWAMRIQDIVRGIPDYDEVKAKNINAEEEPYYALLGVLQYPALSRLDVAWRNVSGDTTENQQLREDLKDQWMKTFFAWIRGYGRDNTTIHLRQGGTELDSPYPPNDPSVVYYHGPLHDGEPEPLLPFDARNDQVTIQKLLDRLALQLPLSIEEWEILEAKICQYWQPGNIYKASTSLEQTIDEEAAKNFKSKFSLFLRAGSDCNFSLLLPWEDEKAELIAHDPTCYLPKDWSRSEGAAPQGFVSHGGNYKEKLKQLWPYPRQLQEAISDMEQEIDRRLRGFRDAQTPTAADYSYFESLLNPFLTPELRRLEKMMKQTRNAKERKGLRSLFNEAFFVWVTRLERQSLKNMIRIRDVDPSKPLEQFPSPKDGVLYFERPFRMSEATPIAVVDLPALPNEWLAVENTINKLLKRFHYRKEHPADENGRDVFTWEDDDERRRNLRAVMDRGLAEADIEFRSLEDRYRHGLLQGQELADYLTFAADWRQRYEEWISEMPKSGIRLRKTTRNSPLRNNENIYDLYLSSPDELPPKFRSSPDSRIPQDIIEKTLAINSHLATTDDWEVVNREKSLLLSTEQESYRTLLKTLWRPTRTAIIDKYSQDESMFSPHKIGTVIPDKWQELYRKVAIKALLRQKFVAWYNGLADRVRNANSIVEVYEQVRGATQLRERKSETKSNDILPKVSDSFVMSSITGWDTAWLEFVVLSLRIINGVATPAELEHVRLSKRPESNVAVINDLEARPTIAAVIDNPNEGTIDLEIARRNATVAEGAEEYQMTLKLLWIGFSDLSRTFPCEISQRTYEDTLDTLDPIDELILKHDLVQEMEPILVLAPTSDELRAIEIELNNMLYESGKNNLTQVQEAVLNYLLRPLLRGELDQLFRNLINLFEKSQDDVEFISTGQSVALGQYSSEFTQQFEKWKIGIMDRGIVLDQFYLGIDFDRVVSRYRRWKDAISKSKKSNPTLELEYFENPLFLRTKKQHELLKEYISDPDSEVDFSGLALPAMPQSLKIAHDEWRKHNDENTKQLARNIEVSDTDTLLLTGLCHSFVDEYFAWFTNLPTVVFRSFVKAIRESSSETPDFSGKAERRGVQRAAIELGLNLLATNEEQHRPADKFRKVKLPTKSKPEADKCPLSQPLQSSERPVEMDPQNYIKLLRRYRQWKDCDYLVARQVDRNDRAPDEMPPEDNFNGPKSFPTEANYQNMLAENLEKLTRLQQDLIDAQMNAPRPLLRRMLELVKQGVCCDTHNLLDTELLRQSDVEVLTELTQQSWREDILPYASMAGREREMLIEFEQDLSSAAIWVAIPFWETTRSGTRMTDLREQRYDKTLGSNKFIYLEELIQLVNDRRAIEELRPWRIAEATRFVAYMSSANRLHADRADEGMLRIARIPPNGHPENKYVASEQDASKASYIKIDPLTNHCVVQYNLDGLKGPPILQPNKYEYLQRIAFRLGRDIRDILANIGHPHDTEELRSNQGKSSRKAMQTLKDITKGDITLQKIALDLHEVAPDLAAEHPDILDTINNDPASLSEKDAGTLIQMELIQEVNNNWEPRFPENEHVWDFAAPRLVERELSSNNLIAGPQQPRFFDMRRWPLPCQAKATQEKIESSGALPSDTVGEESSKNVEEPITPKRPFALRRTQPKARQKPVERWTGRGQAPYFPFGETPYQQAYMSFRMEQDLMDVEDFNPKPPRNLSWAAKLRKFFTPTPVVENIDPTALPVVKGWVPDSVSEAHKRYVISERKLAAPGYPDEEEFYFNPQEIAERRRQEEALEMQLRHICARTAVEKWYEQKEGGKVSYDDLTRAEKRAAWAELNIDPLREVERTPSPIDHAGSKRRGSAVGGVSKIARL